MRYLAVIQFSDLITKIHPQTWFCIKIQTFRHATITAFTNITIYSTFANDCIMTQSISLILILVEQFDCIIHC